MRHCFDSVVDGLVHRSAVRRFGCSVVRLCGDSAVRQFGESAARRLGGWAVWLFGGSAQFSFFIVFFFAGG
jgi:hypothetical protein